MAERARPSVAALIVNYRTYDDLGRCLSALDRHEPSVAIVVIDYESHPGGVAEIQQKWPRVRVIPSAGNDGFGAGVNRAASEVPQASRLLVLNPDTILEAPIVDTLDAVMAGAENVGAIAPLVRETDGGIQPSARRFPGMSTLVGGRSTWLTRMIPGNRWSARNLLTGPDVREPIVVDWVSGACMLIRRQAFDAVGGFDDRFFLYWEDADLCRRLRAAGWTTVYHPGAEVRHAAGQASRQVPARAQRAFHRSVFRYYLKHGGLVAWVGAPIVWPAIQARLVLKLFQGYRIQK